MASLTIAIWLWSEHIQANVPCFYLYVAPEFVPIEQSFLVMPMQHLTDHYSVAYFPVSTELEWYPAMDERES